MTAGGGPLEPDANGMRALLANVSERIVRELEALPAQRASDTEGGQAVALKVREPLPEQGRNADDVFDLVFGELLSKGYNTASAGTLSYVTGGGLFHSAVGERIAAATNRYVAYWAASPGLAELEHTVIRWFCDIVDYPESAGGVLLSGGSMANLTALVAARRSRIKGDFSKATLYTSDQVHHSVQKSVVIAGFAEDALRILPSDASYRLSPTLLSEAVERDRRDGRVPLAVVATAGTTNSGAVDDLSALAAVCKEQDLWLHVDAAYGGFFALTERGRAVLAGIELADTVVLDPHKSLFLPFGTGCLLAKDVRLLERSHQLHSEYIHAAVELGDAAGARNFGDLSAEMSRSARGLRVWLPMKLLGAQAFRDALDEKLDLARHAARELEQMEGYDVLGPPVLSTVVFRARLPGQSGSEQDDLNRRILDRVNHWGRVHLSATRLDERFTLRICVLSFRTHRDTIATCLAELRRALAVEREV